MIYRTSFDLEYYFLTITWTNYTAKRLTLDNGFLEVISHLARLVTSPQIKPTTAGKYEYLLMVGSLERETDCQYLHRHINLDKFSLPAVVVLQVLAQI